MIDFTKKLAHDKNARYTISVPNSRAYKKRKIFLCLTENSKIEIKKQKAKDVDFDLSKKVQKWYKAFNALYIENESKDYFDFNVKDFDLLYIPYSSDDSNTKSMDYSSFQDEAIPFYSNIPDSVSQYEISKKLLCTYNGEKKGWFSIYGTDELSLRTLPNVKFTEIKD